MLDLHGAARVAAQRGLQGRPCIRGAILGLHRQGAPQRIEAKQRIGARHQGHGRNRGARNQVPAHHIAKRLVHTHAIHVHRQALGRAQQRRRRVAAVIHIHLEGIALHLVDVDAAQAAIHEVTQLQRAAALDVPAPGHLYRRGDLVARLAQARQRGAANDLYRVQCLSLLRMRADAECCAERQHDGGAGP